MNKNNTIERCDYINQWINKLIIRNKSEIEEGKVGNLILKRGYKHYSEQKTSRIMKEIGRKLINLDKTVGFSIKQWNCGLPQNEVLADYRVNTSEVLNIYLVPLVSVRHLGIALTYK